MKKYFFLFAVASCIPSFLSAQEAEKKVREFVDNIVETIDEQIQYFINKQKENTSSQKNSSSEDLRVEGDAVTFNGDTEVAKNDTVHGDIIVKNGTLMVYGVVTGDAVVFNGIIKVRSGSHVLGNVRAINGAIVKDENALIDGYTEEADGKSHYKKKTLRAKYSYAFAPNAFWLRDEMIDELGMFRYNRVEGLFLGVGSEKKFFWDGSRTVSGWGSVGYGFAMHKWRMQLGIDRQFAASDALYELGSEVHSVTDTKDDWIVKTSENTAAAIFLREDYRDYFQREGFSVHAARYTRDEYSTMLDVRYSYDRYNSLDKNTNWAVFAGRNMFRVNPKINEGIMRSVKISAGVSSVEKLRRISEGWNLFAGAEYSGRPLGGDFNFTNALLDLRRYQPLSPSDEISARVRIGTLSGNLISQRLYEIGGANTLPGYRFKEFAGNRMMLINFEYQNTELLGDISFLPSSFRFILFADAGAAAFVPASNEIYEGFNAITSSQIKSDIGFGLGLFGDDMRVGFAWRTDIASPVTVFLRLNRTF